jgi:ribonuclease Y
VGWLCGLLASELNLSIKQARRAGMLHDIGKSMDHAMDGGHAVIGADFIKSRNESPDVVHAVRAHHFDEAPSTDLAYLVIAADAISGARPGARRNTIESYNQKVSELEAIAKSFNGVDDCYVLSGGREVRIIANGKTLSDSKALDLSRNVAQRIEAEVTYPGQIKVVVVRSTHSQETTKTAH